MRPLGPNGMGRTAFARGPDAEGLATLQTGTPRPRPGESKEHPMWQTALLDDAVAGAFDGLRYG